MKVNDFFKGMEIWKTALAYVTIMILLAIVSMIPGIEGCRWLDAEFYTAMSCFCMILWFALMMSRRKVDFAEAARDFAAGTRKREMVYLAFLNIIFSMGSVLMLIGMLSLISPTLVEKAMAEPAENINTAASQVFNFIGAVFLAPVMEELMFRGVLLNRLKSRVNLWLAIILSSVAFGLLHAGVSAFGAVVFGIVMSVVYLKTENILTCMGVHFLNNLAASLPRLFTTGESAGADEAVTDAAQLVAGGTVGAVAVVITGIFLIRYVMKNRPQK